MLADVQERAQLSVTSAHDEDRDVAHMCRHELAGLRELIGAGDVLPEAAEDMLLLGPEHVWIGVPAPGKHLPARYHAHHASL